MDNKGIVFDIQRFSLHDGPGIRTTVFLKGCPLRCKWCHNPESWQLSPQLLYKKDKCQNCMKCVQKCPTGAHYEKDGCHSFESKKCNRSFQCIEECPYEALKTAGKEMSALEVMKEVEADAAFYKNSGGGMTVSGGEPMLQYEFLLELLKLAKGNNLHTCIETSGYASKEKFEEILNLVDIFLFDYKVTSDSKHKELTGVSNKIILENLDFIYYKNTGIILRCPLIPGVNDSEDHLQGIAGLCEKYPKFLGIEIMPYHNIGKGKWTEVGLDYELCDLDSADEAMKELWLEKLKKLGCQKVRIS